MDEIAQQEQWVEQFSQLLKQLNQELASLPELENADVLATSGRVGES
jgi:hypothetical protein